MTKPMAFLISMVCLVAFRCGGTDSSTPEAAVILENESALAAASLSEMKVGGCAGEPAVPAGHLCRNWSRGDDCAWLECCWLNEKPTGGTVTCGNRCRPGGSGVTCGMDKIGVGENLEATDGRH